tara:strand:- start:147 stop:2168 length:2022 start_codon:yes stop_codon:yes gene_type:complete
METQIYTTDTRQVKRAKVRKSVKQEQRVKTLISEAQKIRVDGGLWYQTHITQSYADMGIIDAQSVRVYSKKHFTTFNVDSEIEGVRWNGVDTRVFAEIKQCLKGEGIIKVHEIADAFKEDHPDCKYGVIYKDGGIPKGDFKKLEKYPNIDFVIPESELKDFLSNPRELYVSTDFDEDIVDNEVMNRLKAYDESLTDYMLECVIGSISLEDKIRMIEAPTGFGKTHFSVHTMFPYHFKSLGIELVVYIVPQKALMALKKLNSVNYPPGTQVTYDWDSAMEMLESGFKTILAISDNTFSYDKKKKVGTKAKPMVKDLIIDLCANKGYKDKVLICRDEGHYSGSSGEDFYYKNMGSKPYKYQASLFNAIAEVLKYTRYVYYLSATPLHEQFNATFGSEKYALINEHPNKEELLLRTAKIRNITFNPELNDEGRKIKTGAKYMIAAVENMMNREKSLHSFVDQCELEEGLDFLQLNGSHPLKKKQTIIVKLERKSDGKVKVSTENVIELIEEADLQHDFDFVISTSEDGIQSYSILDGKVTENHKVYSSEQKIYDSLEDKSSPLRMYIVIEKGSMGVDIPSASTLLIFRKPKTFFKGKPVTTNGIQLFGRLARLQIKIDDLYEYKWKCKEDFVKYYTMANSFDIFCEDTDYWRQTQLEYISKQGVIENVNRHLYKEL